MLRYIVVACAALLVARAQIQVPQYDPALLRDLFGPPPSAPTQPPVVTLPPVTVKPTESCQCLPYYLCDNNGNGLEGTFIPKTGYNLLDVRFGQPGDPIPNCQESVELCCTLPKDISRPSGGNTGSGTSGGNGGSGTSGASNGNAGPGVTVKPKPKPANPSCGYRNPKGLGAPILGHGGESQFGEYPWVAALMNNNGSFIGAGVIIHPQVIMTGAHVAYKYGPNNLKIRAGEWDTQTVKEIYDSQERVVQEIYTHSDFNRNNLKNDIALLRLQQPLQLEEHINTLCLPDVNDNFDTSKQCVSNGWGKDSFGAQGQFAVIQKKVSQDMMTADRCQSLLRRTRLGRHFRLHRSFVCAGGQAGQDTCEGDGGAALACPIGNERYKLTGLVSWGIGCGGKDIPSVFTNVALFRTWVDEKMKAWGYGTTTYTV